MLTSAISVLSEEGHGAIPTVDPTSAGSLALPLVLVIALPALGAVILLLGGRRTDRFGHLLGTATVLGSFVCSVVLFFSLLGRADDNRQVGLTLWTWFSSGDWKVEMGLLYDPLSALFLLLITGVGSLIFIYSIGYMEHDERRRRFFGYLNLFVAAMLVLVLASDYVGVFLGWEGVGLASYLLIGFWQYKPSAAAAAKKAFVINRVGDIGLSLGVGLIFVTFGSTSFAKVSTLTSGASQGVMTVIGLLLLLAACGKSAQFPLQTWLLDAMEGPTPVSALIHAATMVTAGVYLIVRSQFIFAYTADARLAVAVVGTITLADGCLDRVRQGRHQEGPRGLDDEPDRLHGPGGRDGRGRLRVRDLPPAHARLLQGQHVPRSRLGDARHRGRRQHAPLRSPSQADAGDVRDLHDGVPRDHRCSPRSTGSGPRTRSSRSR